MIYYMLIAMKILFVVLVLVHKNFCPWGILVEWLDFVAHPGFLGAGKKWSVKDACVSDMLNGFK